MVIAMPATAMDSTILTKRSAASARAEFSAPRLARSFDTAHEFVACHDQFFFPLAAKWQLGKSRRRPSYASDRLRNTAPGLLRSPAERDRPRIRAYRHRHNW